MRIPTKLKIGGLTWTIEIVEKIDNRDALGITDPEDLTIKIQKANVSVMQQTLIHEILHAINYQKDHEEIEYLSQALYQVINDNDFL